MLRSKTTMAAVTGFVLCVAGLAWGAVNEHLHQLNDPPGWIMDREFYPPARTMAHIGFYVFALAVMFGIARWIYAAVHAAINSPSDQT